jgi:hypothetical protein
MTTGRHILHATLLVGIFFAGFFFHAIQDRIIAHTTYFKLEQPLLIEAEGEAGNFHVLPAGTPMYKDASLPEGHTRYIVYVNVKGGPALQKVESDEAQLIDPVWGYPVRPEDVPAPVAETPVSKDELVRILKARKMTREELAQIVREWRD